jgi:hypothetical protein
LPPIDGGIARLSGIARFDDDLPVDTIDVSLARSVNPTH